MFVNREVANPVPPESILSPDEILRATVHRFGTFLKADFGRMYPTNPLENLASNSNFDTLDGTSAGGSATRELSTTHVKYGTRSIMLVSNGSSNGTLFLNDLVDYPNLQPGKPYTFSVWVYMETPISPLSTGNALKLNAYVYNEALTSNTLVYGDSIENVAGWQRVTLTLTTPEEDFGTVRIRWISGSAASVITQWLDGFQIEEGEVATEFFDDVTPLEGYAVGPNHFSTGSIAIPDNPLDSVRFMRKPDQYVRSGYDAKAPDGVAHAFDIEAPLSVQSTWVAYPVFFDGSVGEPSAGVTLINSEPTGFYDTWLKSVDQPELSHRVLLTKDNIPSFNHPARNNISNPQGRKYPVVSRDKHVAASLTLTAYTQTTDEEEMMEALLESGTLLFQTKAEYHVKDFYCVVGDFEMSLTGAGTALVSRRWTIPLQIVDRPTPIEAPFVIPGESYDDMANQTYDQLGDAWSSYNVLTETPASGFITDRGAYYSMSTAGVSRPLIEFSEDADSVMIEVTE